jgi:hypothetical protein
MALRKGEDPIDVSRRALVRLREMALGHYDETVEGSFTQVYWNGYIRALEHIIEMEDE